MNRKSAIVISAGLVFALMIGTVSRVVTLHSAAAVAPVRIVVQTTAPQPAPAPASAPSSFERE
jgi:hypothetical protein